MGLRYSRPFRPLSRLVQVLVIGFTAGIVTVRPV